MNNQYNFLTVIENNEIITIDYIKKFFQDLVEDNKEKISIIGDFHIDKIEGYITFSMLVISENITSEKFLDSIWEDFCNGVKREFYKNERYNMECAIEKEEG